MEAGAEESRQQTHDGHSAVVQNVVLHDTSDEAQVTIYLEMARGLAVELQHIRATNSDMTVFWLRLVCLVLVVLLNAIGLYS